MTDFETHPACTADMMKRLLANGLDECDEAATRIEQLEAALTRANAATAAAYEVAARAIMEKCHDDMDRKEEAAVVRAIATPDQRSALDRLIAEAVGPYKSVLKDLIDHADEISSPLVEAQQLLAASKKGGA